MKLMCMELVQDMCKQVPNVNQISSNEEIKRKPGPHFWQQCNAMAKAAILIGTHGANYLLNTLPRI